MERIMIIGFSGCGKSTLARRIGEKTGIEPVHMDALHWLPGWVESDDAHKTELLKPVLEKKRWIIEGSYRRILWNERIENADTIIFLDYNRFLCLWRVIKRRIMYSGKTRPDMGKGCVEKLDAEFIYWVLIEGRRKRKKFYSELDQIRNIFPEKDIYIFVKPSQCEKFLDGLE